MDNQLKVSVIVPVYNVEKYLEECVEAIINQTLKETEIIFVNDGSVDSSLSILQKYEKLDSRIIVLDQENQGAAVARNKAIDIAKGKYLVFLDSDDFFELDLLELQYNACEKYGADISLCSGSDYDQVTGEVVDADYFLRKEWVEKECFNAKDLKEKAFQVSYPGPCNKMCLTEFIRKYDLKFQLLTSVEDLYFSVMAMALAEKITYVDKRLYSKRVVEERKEDSKNSEDLCIELLRINNQLIDLELYEDLRWAFINLSTNLCYLELLKVEEDSQAYSNLCALLSKSYIKELEIDAFPEPEMMFEDYHKAIMNRVVKEEYNNIIDSREELDKPKVSVIMPVYNTEPYLDESLESIINQTLKDIEIICVNDGSTDNSLQMLEEYAQKDARISVYTQENQGPSVARNVGLEVAKGKYIYFMDSDDILSLEALDYLYNESTRNQLEVLYFDATYRFHSKEIEARFPDLSKMYSYERGSEFGEVYYGCELMTELESTYCYRSPVWIQFILRDYLNENKLRFYEGIIHEDELFTFKCMIAAKRTSHRKKSFFIRRLRENSIMTKPVGTKNLRGQVFSYVYMNEFADTFRFSSNYKKMVYKVINHMKEDGVRSIKEILASGEQIPENLFADLDKTLFQEAMFKLILDLSENSNGNSDEKDMLIEYKQSEIDNREEVIEWKLKEIEWKDKIISSNKEKHERLYGELKQSYQNMQNLNNEKLVKMKNLFEVNKALREENKTEKKNMERLEKEYSQNKLELENIKKSRSYRIIRKIGRILNLFRRR